MVSTASAPNHSAPPMTISTDKLSYNHGDIMEINGKGAQSYSISIQIISPEGNVIEKLSTFSSGSGEFSTLWVVPNDLEFGTYTIKVQDATQVATTDIRFLGEEWVVEELEPPSGNKVAEERSIPDWIKNNAGWWAEGLIGDSDFLQGIKFLIEKEIMVIPIPEADTQKLELKDEKRAMGLERDEKVPDWVRKNAGWWAEGLISEGDFLNGIQYMIKVGIIVVKTMNLTTDVFSESGLIPSEYTCDGPDISPKLIISDVPKTAKSLALIMDDPDAPMGTFVHWVVWNISPDKSTIAKGENLVEPQGKTDFGKTGYGGPCPPSGTHRYFFKLYALDTILELDPSSTKKDLVEAIEDHIMEQTILVGKYSRN